MNDSMEQRLQESYEELRGLFLELYPGDIAALDYYLDMLRRSFEYAKGQTLNVSGSVGIALSPEFGASFETLFSCADKALYEARRSCAPSTKGAWPTRTGTARAGSWA